MVIPRSIQIWAFVLFVVSEAFFLFRIDQPKTLNFDEFHYVPAARELYEGKVTRNREHPPVAKYLIGASMKIFGDEPLGWRFVSTVFGAATVSALFLLSWLWLGNLTAAFTVAALSIFNHLLFVQARIAMLDPFLFGFIAWGVVFLELGLRRVRGAWVLGGVCMGLAVASKWFGVIPLAATVGLLVILWLMGSALKNLIPVRLPEGTRFFEIFFAWGIVPVGVYFLTFIPYLWVRDPGFSFGDLFALQGWMYGDQQRVTGEHPYSSHWWQWVTLTRPMWYAFDYEGPENSFVRGIALIGNPWIMWTGVLAVGACIWGWAKENSRSAFWIAFFYLAFTLSWAVIPRKVSFYYYYVPSGMFLSLAVAWCLDRWATGGWKSPIRWAYLLVAGAIFAYFYPILAAVKIPTESYSQWMWLRSWI